MDKWIAALCMLVVTVCIFLIPKLYIEHIDTRLDENRQDYSYNINIKSNLDFSEKKEMLINSNCIVDTTYNFKTYESIGLIAIEKKLTKLINNMYFKDEYINEQIKYADLSEILVSRRTDFKLIDIDDDVIKTYSIKTCIFEADWYKGFAMYDIVTSDIYIVYVIAEYRYHPYGSEGCDSYKSMFEAKEILNGKTINNILENMPWEKENVMIDLFRELLRDSQQDFAETDGFSIFNE